MNNYKRRVDIGWSRRIAGPLSLARLPVVCVTVGVLLLCGCTEAIVPDGLQSVDALDDPDGSDPGADGGFIGQPANTEDPTVLITSPSPGSTNSDASLEVTGNADDDSGLATVFVRVGDNAPVLAQSSDGFRTWRVDAPTPVGSFDVEAIAYDTDGRASERAVVSLTGRVATGGSQAPTVVIDSPADGTSPLQTVVVLQGTSSDDGDVVGLELSVNGVVLDERRFETSDNYGTWGRLLPLLPGQPNVIRVQATDDAGNIGIDEITLYGRNEPDREPPSLTIQAPGAGQTVDTAELAVVGSASDNLGVRGVRARSGFPHAETGCTDRAAVAWSSWFDAETSDGFANFAVTIPVESGAICAEVRAVDVSGLATSELMSLTNLFVSEWSSERLYFMRLRDNGGPRTVLMSLSKDGLNEVIDEDIQRDIVISELDATPLLFNSLSAIKQACGTCWRGDCGSGNVGNYDCTQTDLGCSFGTGPGCDGWQESPEYALVRLLTLTPRNAELEGTSFEGLKDVADAINAVTFGLVDGFSELLAQILGIDQDDSVVSTTGAVRAISAGLVSTHPNIVFDESGAPLLQVTMYDAAQDLAPLADTYGPAVVTDGVYAGETHPGILDPSSPAEGVVFPPEFRMILLGESNLRWYDGVRLDSGKDYISILNDVTGPTYDDVVEFDFTDPNRFEIVGLPAEPTVSLRFSMQETARDIPVCAGDDACKNNLPGSPLGNSYAWSLLPWQLEYILASAGRETYPDRETYVSYLNVPIVGPQAEIFVGQGNDPDTWTRFSLSGLAESLSGGPPPEPQYLWDVIMDMAEVIGHRNVGGPGGCPAPFDEYQICEGDLNVAFDLRDIPTGVTAEQLEDDSRTFLQAQRKELGDRLLGGFEENNGCVDFYYRELDGRPMLVYADASDPRPSTNCPDPSLQDAGFFADADLTQPVSQRNITGVSDAVHHKLELSEGESIVFLRGADGAVYRAQLDVPDLSQTSEITLSVARRMVQ